MTYMIHTKMEGRLILNIIGGKCVTILKPFTSVKKSRCGSGRMPFLSWILALTLSIVFKDLASGGIVLPTNVSMKICMPP